MRSSRQFYAPFSHARNGQNPYKWTKTKKAACYVLKKHLREKKCFIRFFALLCFLCFCAFARLSLCTFCCFCAFCSVASLCFLCICLVASLCLCAWNLFLKIIKSFEIALTTSFTILLLIYLLCLINFFRDCLCQKIFT